MLRLSAPFAWLAVSLRLHLYPVKYVPQVLLQMAILPPFVRLAPLDRIQPERTALNASLVQGDRSPTMPQSLASLVLLGKSAVLTRRLVAPPVRWDHTAMGLQLLAPHARRDSTRTVPPCNVKAVLLVVSVVMVHRHVLGAAVAVLVEHGPVGAVAVMRAHSLASMLLAVAIAWLVLSVALTPALVSHAWEDLSALGLPLHALYVNLGYSRTMWLKHASRARWVGSVVQMRPRVQTAWQASTAQTV